MPDTIKEAERQRGKKHRRLARKKHMREDAYQFRQRQHERLRMLLKERDEARENNRPDRVDELNKKIDECHLAIQRVNESIKRLKRKIPDIKEAIRKLTAWIKRRRRRNQRNDIEFSPGSPHWGGCADVYENELVPALGRAHSTKREETFGNPGSDHHVSQVWAHAGDFASGVSIAIRIAKELGVGYSGYADDYKLYYIVREGRTIRVQIIAQNHGTGPHTHEGMELT